MTIRLLIARHGNTFAPSEPVRRVGVTDLPLAHSGLTQGRILGTYLKHINLIPDVIFTSKLQRTIQTAEQAQSTMGTTLPIKTLSMFNEIDYGPDENQPEKEVIARIGKTAMKAWEEHALIPKGWCIEPKTLIKNWIDFSIHLRKECAGKIVLVITSNGIARFSPYLTGDFDRFCLQYKIKIATGAVCLFEHTEPSEVWLCRAWNSDPKLIPD